MNLPDPSAGLNDELRVATVLLQLLQQEQATLIEATIDGLTELTRVKASHITELSILAKQRYAALGANSFELNEAGMRKWIVAQPEHGVVRALWNALLHKASEAKELNRINGMLVARHLLRNQTELNILQGKPQNSSFYGPNGQSTAKGLGRGLGIG